MKEAFGRVGPIDSNLEEFSRMNGYPGGIFDLDSAIQQKIGAAEGVMEMNSNNALFGFPFGALMKLNRDKPPRRMGMADLLQGGKIDLKQLFLENIKSDHGTGEWRGSKDHAHLSHDNTLRMEVTAHWMSERFRQRVTDVYNEMKTLETNVDRLPFRIEGGTLLGENPSGRVVVRLFMYDSGGASRWVIVFNGRSRKKRSSSPSSSSSSTPNPFATSDCWQTIRMECSEAFECVMADLRTSLTSFEPYPARFCVTAA